MINPLLKSYVKIDFIYKLLLGLLVSDFLRKIFVSVKYEIKS